MSCLLSVIIPVYNAEKFLSICLESIIEARIDGLEIILVDDGSTDKSAEVCRVYQEKYPFVHYLYQENAGPSAARNNGLRYAKGQYVAFFDADDYVTPEVFAKHLELLTQYPAEIWVSDFERVADNGCVLDKVYQIKQSEAPITDNEYLTEFLAAKDCVWNVWRYIFKKDFLTENKLLFAEGYHCAEDLEFAVRALIKAECFAFYHEPYYSYRVNYGASLTRRYSLSR
ncbi:MAG: glycosyltransferase, partial [Oscillospiraceae bacterium]|nr:glycosyltransferase [Oscillospiraceae bacterium]